MSNKIYSLTLCGLTVFLINILVHLSLTSYIAAAVDYDPALGELGAAGIYPLLSWTRWTYEFGAANQSVFAPPLLMMLGIMMAVGILVYFRERGVWAKPATSDVHGTAAWGGLKEAKQAGMFAKSGICLGAVPGLLGRPKLLLHDGPGHVACIAPTRAGKGVGVVVPTLFSWRGAAVVYDQKGELWALTSGWRAKNVGPVYCYRPASGGTPFKFNPLDTVRLGEAAETGDAQNLALILTERNGKGMGEDHWINSARSLLSGIVLYVCYNALKDGRDATINDLVDTLTSTKAKPKDLFSDMQAYTVGEPERIHREIASVGSEFDAKPERELGSIWSTAITCLELYRDPVVAASMSSTTLPFQAIVDSDKPCTVYIVAGESEKDRLKPLIRLFYTQMIRVLLRRDAGLQSESPYKHSLLLLIDEFISLGKMDYLQEALSYIAGYGMRALLVIQDISQLQSLYGKEESIIANTHVRIVFAPNRVETAKWISDMLGRATVNRKEKSSDGKTRHVQSGRDLLLADEIMRLKGFRKKGRKITAGEQLVFVSGHRPFLCQQTPYFLSKSMREYASIPPPSGAPV